MKLYNTLSGKLETFQSSNDVVKMYVCGVTPYSQSHVGHVLRAVVFDVLRRYLEFKGFLVKHVENFTDIDDKMIQRAESTGVSTNKLADDNINIYLSEIKEMNILPAHVYPRATQEIPKIIEMIEGLIGKGFAYCIEGNVYFRVRKDEDYGKLGRRSLDTMIAGSRVEIDENKEDVMDFALWKCEKPGEPSWDSPWGYGRPGWHIECSAMALSHLGFPIDIHGGGQDLVFPHHENEIAQSESYVGSEPMSRYWVHNGLVRLGSGKMSKSDGNLVTVKDALQNHSADELRLFFLSAHYRSPLSYTEEGVSTQTRAVERLRNAVRSTSPGGSSYTVQIGDFKKRFISAMDDDLNTPRALAVLFELSRHINKGIENGYNVVQIQDTLQELCNVLGLTLAEPIFNREPEFFPLIHLLVDTNAELRSRGREDLSGNMYEQLRVSGISIEEILGVGGQVPKSLDGFSSSDADKIITILVELRDIIRSEGLYELSDSIRERFGDLGFILEDSSTGTKWKRG